MHNPAMVVHRRELKIVPSALDLVREMIRASPSDRLKLEQVGEQQWVCWPVNLFYRVFNIKQYALVYARKSP
jgi:hypothetical protein